MPRTLPYFVRRESATPSARGTHTKGLARPVDSGNPSTFSARVPVGARTRKLASLHRAILGLGNKGGRGGRWRQRGRGPRTKRGRQRPCDKRNCFTLRSLELRIKEIKPGGGQRRNKRPRGKEVAEKRAGGERETKSVQGDKQKGRRTVPRGAQRGFRAPADPQVPSCPGARLSLARCSLPPAVPKAPRRPRAALRRQRPARWQRRRSVRLVAAGSRLTF